MLIEFDHTDEKRVRQYEEGLYKSFPDPKGSPLRKLWKYNHEEQRISLPSPPEPEHVFYYGGLVDDQLTAACAFNGNPHITWKTESLGFKVDKGTGDICEGLTLFSLETMHDGKWMYEEVHNYTVEELRKRGFRKTYGTCMQEKIDFYRAWGHEIAAIKIIDYEKVYLTIMDL